MGSIIRLNTVFNNAKLKTLQDYDTDTLKQQILALPTLRAFYDATDKANMTMSGNLVTRLNDLSANQLHFVQTTTSNAPSYDEQAFGHVGGLVFRGGEWLTANNLFNARQVGSIVVFAKGDKGGLNVIMSSASNASVAIYTRDGSIMALNGGVGIGARHANIMPTNIVLSYNTTQNTAVINPGYMHTVSASAAGGVRIANENVNLGRWSNTKTEMYAGKIGHVMMFDEDLSKNQAVLDLVQEYAKRKYRI